MWQWTSNYYQAGHWVVAKEPRYSPGYYTSQVLPLIEKAVPGVDLLLTY